MSCERVRAARSAELWARARWPKRAASRHASAPCRRPHKQNATCARASWASALAKHIRGAVLTSVFGLRFESARLECSEPKDSES